MVKMKHVLFIQGAAKGAYKIDKLLADNLQQELGAEYKVTYPKMPDEDNAPYKLWKEKIESELNSMSDPIVLVGHSVGASHLAKSLTEIKTKKTPLGIFLLETPFWGGNGWHYEGYKEIALPKDAAAKFPQKAHIFLYHTRDDEVIPFDHLALYAKLIPQAIVREIPKGGHQLNNDLSTVASDIHNLIHNSRK